MTKAPKANEIESQPDAWEQFERAVDTVVKAPPQHKPAKRTGESPPERGLSRENNAPPKAHESLSSRRTYLPVDAI